MSFWSWTGRVSSSTVPALGAFAILTACARFSAPLPDYGAVSAFQLTNQSGKEFRSADHLTNEVWLAGFIFTNCQGPCPRMGAQMRRVQETVPAIKLVSFTIDPARDTPPVLDRYAGRFGAHPARWYFLTGAMQDLNHLCQDVFHLGSVDGTLEHPTKLVLVDKQGHIRGYYSTSEIERLIEDAKRLTDQTT